MSIYRNMTREEMDDIKGRILYEDNHILIFNKVAGEIVQGDKTGDEPLSETLKAYISHRDEKPGAVFMGVPHRLDRPVSGIALFAKTSKALERMDAMFAGGEVDKRYWALVCRKPERESAVLVNCISRNEKQNRSYVYPAPRQTVEESNDKLASCSCAAAGKSIPSNAKLAKLEYRYLGSSERYFLLEVKLFTGRHHQIRAQLSAIGSPIKGDLKYGAPRSNKDGSICLHARSIEFIHPVRKIPLKVEAPVIQSAFKVCLPNDFQNIQHYEIEHET